MGSSCVDLKFIRSASLFRYHLHSTATELKNIGFDLGELHDRGFSISELKEACFVPADFEAASQGIDMQILPLSGSSLSAGLLVAKRNSCQGKSAQAVKPALRAISTARDDSCRRDKSRRHEAWRRPAPHDTVVIGGDVMIPVAGVDSVCMISTST